MYRIFLSLIVMMIVTTASMAQGMSQYDFNAPFGWCGCTSLTDGDACKVTGGGEGSRDTLVSTGEDMRKQITKALRENDIVVLDGSHGDFIISKRIEMDDLRDKTIVGINGARISTQFKIDAEIRNLLNSKNVKQYVSASTGNGGFILSNGKKVKEERESVVRQTLIDYLKDDNETYRDAGVFSFDRSENIIMRNLTFVGPGSIDVGGSDLMTISHASKHIWIDHCDFIDGMDGNFDINSYSDFITISWCRFKYTENSFDHSNTNLIGSSDREFGNGEDNLNVTYYACNWDKGCDQRMPMVRFGTVHLLNNLYSCEGCTRAVNPRFHSEVLIEGNVFTKGVKRIFQQNDAKSVIFRNNSYAEKFKQPADLGSMSLPYSYAAMPVDSVEAEVRKYCGATLENPLEIK